MSSNSHHYTWIPAYIILYERANRFYRSYGYISSRKKAMKEILLKSSVKYPSIETIFSPQRLYK